jgi:hypothetical protein
MILSNRRYRIVYISLAAMDVACLLPYVLTWTEHGRRWNDAPLAASAAGLLTRPVLLFLFWWLLMVAYFVVADTIDRRQITSPRRELIFLLLVIGTSLAGIRLFVYPLSDPGNFHWLADTGRSLLEFSEGVTPPLLFILLNTFLWARVAMAADRELTFWSVGVSFRLGLLLAIVGGSLLSTIGGRSAQEALFYFTTFFAFGLLAISIARIDEKSVGDTRSPGRKVPIARLVDIVALTCVIVGVALSTLRVFTPSALRSWVSVFEPLQKAVGLMLGWVILAVFSLIGPLMDRLLLAIQRLATGGEPVQAEMGPPPPLQFGNDAAMRDWTLLRYGLVIAAVVIALAILWFLFVKPDEEGAASEDEEPEQEESRSAIAPAMPHFGRLRDWLRMLRRYGMNQRLLNAISVENMYANLGRMARKRGHPRLPSQPPDDYLPQLASAFPGQNARLERMTMAYMRVHYGDLPIAQDEMDTLRDDYEAIKDTPASSSNAVA